MSEHAATADPKHESGGAGGHEHHGGLYEHAKPYLLVGVVLFAATALTVFLSYVDFAEWPLLPRMFNVIGVHGIGINIFIGLCLATCKVCLVGWWFMHLKQEKRTVWRPLFFTFFFVMGLFFLFLLAYSDPIPTTSHPIH